MGSRLFGFSQELFLDTQNVDPAAQAVTLRQMAPTYPFLVEIATAASHDDASVVGGGCDDQYEFEFALDLLLDGFEKLKRQQTKSANRSARVEHHPAV